MPEDPEVKIESHGDPQPMPEGFDLLKHTMNVLRSQFDDLDKPDDDIVPVMIWIGPYGLGMFPLLDMGDDEAKDRIAAMMTTVLAVSRATEAVQATPSWAVRVERQEDGSPVLDVMPSQHPDRVECISLIHVTTGGPDQMVQGVVTRYDDKPPTLDEWDTKMSDGLERISGRFGDAVHMGLDFAKEMPPELESIIDEGWATGNQEDLIKRFHKVFTGFSAAMDAMREAGMPGA